LPPTQEFCPLGGKNSSGSAAPWRLCCRRATLDARSPAHLEPRVEFLESNSVPNVRPKTFRERLHKGYAQSMELTRVIAEEKSAFQRIAIFDTVANGRVLVLDDIVQITTRDESAYAEMLVHLPLL